MMDIALYANGTELSIPGYSRQTVPTTALKGIVIFPKLGTANQFHKIESITIFFPTTTNTPLKTLSISAPGGTSTSVFQHEGGKDLRIRLFSDGTMAKATIRTQDEVNAMQLLRSIIVGLDAELTSE